MWLSDLLRKITKGPNVGETFRTYIGCYLYGIEGREQQPTEYLGAPTTLPQLQEGIERYLQDFISTQTDPLSPEVQAVQALLQDLPQRLAAHVAGDMAQPLITVSGAAMFVRKGARGRRKENGRYIE